MTGFENTNRPAKRRTIDGVFISRDSRLPDRQVYLSHIKARNQRHLPKANLTNSDSKHTQEEPRSPIQKPRERINMELPGGESTIKRQFRRIDSIWRVARKWSFRAAVATTMLVIIVGGLLFSMGYLKLHKVFQGGKSAAALQSNVDPSLLRGEGDGRINVLLLGKGGPGHDGPDLTDTMLIFSVDPVNKTASLLSVPRDLWVNMPGEGSTKINAVYADEKNKILQSNPNAKAEAEHAGIQETEQVVGGVLGIPIHYYAMLDFTAFQQAVNTVGGVKINVPQDLYDPTMAWQNNWNPILAKKGAQSFDGYHALLYARSRETSSDFARTERQRQLITALEKKVFTLGTASNPLKISKLIQEFGNHASADMSVSDGMRFYQIIKGIGTSKVQSIGLTDKSHDFLTTDWVGNQSVVRPLAGFFNYSAIQNYVRNTLKDGYIAKENAAIEVVNGTRVAGLGDREAAVLKSYGYRVTSVDDVPKNFSSQKTEIVDLTHGNKKYTAHYLENRFKVGTSAKLSGQIQPNDADFVIILGTDETTSR